MSTQGPSSGGGVHTGDAFRNMMLGLPKEGLAPGSAEAQALHAAEAFVGELQTELKEFDDANARAVSASLSTFASRWGLRRQPPASSQIPGKDAHEQQSKWMFRKRNPHHTPFLQRRWIPWACAAGIVLVWTPDTWKLRTLHYCDVQYAALRRFVHTQYWRATMNPEEFQKLMAEMEANVAKHKRSVKSSDCPF